MEKNKNCDKLVEPTNKKKKLIDMFFNTPAKKVVSLSVLGFLCGAVLMTLTITTFNKANRTGIGGFESQSNPELSLNSEDDEDFALRQIESQILDDTLPALTYKTYRVKSGDMIGKIAEVNNITQDTLISVNNIKQTRLLQVGQYLKIPSLPGILYTVKNDTETFESIAEKYEISAEKCASVNNLSVNASLKAGATLFLPDAQMDWVTRQEINGDLFQRPLHGRYYLSSNYGWRNSPFNTGKRTFHGGTDMASATGTSIYAALDGRVSYTGYNETYGNYVIITHHSGYKTLYGHMSAITCKTGQYVYTSTIIGKVGNTGMSTGPHLHFAVYKNGKSMNPMLLLN